MSHAISRRQAIVLGLVVLLAGGLIGGGLYAVGNRQGLWAETLEVTVWLPDAHDIAPGTPVRIRGVDAGQVVGVDYPDTDDDTAAVTVRMKIDSKFADRLYADASATPFATSLLGGKVISIAPGHPAAGPLADGRLTAKPAPDLADAATKIGDAADETKKLVADVRTGNGTLSKLLNDDSLYQEVSGLAKDSRGMVKKAETAVGAVQDKTTEVDQFVKDGRQTLASVKQGTDAVKALPLIRGYVTDATALMVRPDCRREELDYNAADLFETDSAILTDAGREHLKAVTGWLKGLKNGKAEVVVAAALDPLAADPTGTAAELTRKQAQVVLDHLKKQGGLKNSWVTSRKAAAVGLGREPSPLASDAPLPASNVRILLFTPP